MTTDPTMQAALEFVTHPEVRETLLRQYKRDQMEQIVSSASDFFELEGDQRVAYDDPELDATTPQTYHASARRIARRRAAARNAPPTNTSEDPEEMAKTRKAVETDLRKSPPTWVNIPGQNAADVLEGTRSRIPEPKQATRGGQRQPKPATNNRVMTGQERAAERKALERRWGAVR